MIYWMNKREEIRILLFFDCVFFGCFAIVYNTGQSIFYSKALAPSLVFVLLTSSRRVSSLSLW